MNDARLNDLFPQEMAALRNAGYSSLQTVWQDLERRRQSQVKSVLETISEKSGIPTGRLAGLLAIDALPHPQVKPAVDVREWGLAEVVVLAIPALAVFGLGLRAFLWLGWMVQHVLTMWLR